MRIAIYNRNMPAYVSSKFNLKKIIHDNELDDNLEKIDLYGDKYIAVEKFSSNAYNRQVFDSKGQWRNIFKDFVVYKQDEGKPADITKEDERVLQTLVKY